MTVIKEPTYEELMGIKKKEKQEQPVLTHWDLINSLANTINTANNLIFFEPTLGSRYLRNGEVAIPDLVVIKKSYTNPDIRMYEIKRTRTDLQRDIKECKWEKYLPYCDRFYFAIGPGVEWKDLLSNQPVGVVVRGKKSWRTIRAAPKNPHREDLPEEICLSLMINNCEDPRPDDIQKLEKEKKIILERELDCLHVSKHEEICHASSDLSKQQYEVESKIRELKKYQDMSGAFNRIWDYMSPKKYKFGDASPEKIITDLFTEKIKEAVQECIDELKAAKNKLTKNDK